MYKLKIKVGEFEFDAEGPVEVVQAQFAAFKELISELPKSRVLLSNPNLNVSPLAKKLSP